MATFPFFMGPPVDTAPVFDPFQIPIFTGPGDPGGLGGLIGGLIGGGGPPSMPIPGFGPPQLPAPITPGPVMTMPSPVSMGRCLLRRKRRINWCNPRALSRANRRLTSFNKHARKFIKITHKIKSPKRRRK